MAALIAAEPVDAAIAEAAQVLRSGGTIVIPTDTVYGLGALPSRPAAIDRIFELKERPAGMHLAVLVSGPEQLSLVSTDSRPGVSALAERFWPGALTLVLPEATSLVDGLGDGDGSVGVRCPDHALVRRLAAELGPLAVTSANLHGQPTPETAVEVAAQLPDVDLVVDGGRCPGGVASTVVDLQGDTPAVLRAGPVSQADIDAVWVV